MVRALVAMLNELVPFHENFDPRNLELYNHGNTIDVHQ